MKAKCAHPGKAGLDQFFFEIPCQTRPRNAIVSIFLFPPLKFCLCGCFLSSYHSDFPGPLQSKPAGFGFFLSPVPGHQPGPVRQPASRTHPLPSPRVPQPFPARSWRTPAPPTSCRGRGPTPRRPRPSAAPRSARPRPPSPAYGRTPRVWRSLRCPGGGGRPPGLARSGGGGGGRGVCANYTPPLK